MHEEKSYENDGRLKTKAYEKELRRLQAESSANSRSGSSTKGSASSLSLKAGMPQGRAEQSGQSPSA